jgi:hypothetical protein
MGRLAGIVVVTAALAAIAPGRFGGAATEKGPLRWDGAPRATRVAGTSGDHLLFAHVVNASDRVIRLRAADVHVRDADGDDLRTSAAYADGFVAAVSLRGRGGDLYAGEAASGEPGQAIALRPGESAPLSVSFTIGHDGNRPAGLSYGEGTLSLQ